MKYPHGKEESAEYLRRALPLMSNQNAALHPISYAVWYEYVAGMNAALQNAIDRLLDRRTPLDERDISTLFERHIADLDSDAASGIAAGFQKILGEIAHSTGAVAQDADTFGDLLQRLSHDCETRSGPVDLKVLLSGTQVMQTSIATLKTRLETSQQEIDQLRKEVARARDASLIDGLTGLVNRSGFDQKLADCLADAATQAQASCQGPCLLMCDIDHFKQINDTYGHLFGDKVIRSVAAVIRENVKGRDIAARYGGEEFVVLLPETSLQGAQALAEQIRRAIEKGRIRRGGSEESVARVTLSLGVARYQPGEALATFIERADRALYLSKQNGRNRVTLAAAA
mgnify:CR=1 FL=1